MLSKMFDSLREAQAFTTRAQRLGVSYTVKLITYRKRLKRPMQVRVTVYAPS